MIIAGTGHRPNKLGKEYDYRGPITRYIVSELKRYFTIYKPTDVNSGLALGFDTMLAVLAIKLGIRLWAYIPLKGQELVWNKESQDLYHWILIRAHKIYVVDIQRWVTYEEFKELPRTGYSPTKMQDRNIAMVDPADLIISCFDDSPGGTKNCVDYVDNLGKDRVNIDPRKAKPALL